MRFSAISSREKSCVSSSTVDGSLETAAGRMGIEGWAKAVDELQRKTLPNDCQKDEVELGIEAVLRELARSVSTAALTQYAIAGIGVSLA